MLICLLCLGTYVYARDVFTPLSGIYFPQPPVVEEEPIEIAFPPSEVEIEVFVEEEVIEEPSHSIQIQALILIGRYEDVVENPQDVSAGISFVQIGVPGNAQELVKLLQPYLGAELNSEMIAEIKQTIVRYWHAHKKPLVKVSVPEQDITDGVLQLVITQATLDQVNVRGNRWFSDRVYRKGMRLKSGDIIDERVLVEDLDWLNRNPFRRTDAVYGPGMLPGTTQIELVTKERLPLRVYVGVENTGMEQTGRTRWLTGLNWGNVFGSDNTFSYQYTTSSDFYKFQSHTLQYSAPLPCRHVLDVYGGYSLVHAHLPASHHEHTNGWSLQASMRYHIPLVPAAGLLHELYAGGDFKRTNNTSEFVEEHPLFGKNTNLTQVILGYMGGLERKRFALAWDTYLSWSPGSWLPDQTDADYRTLRPFSQVNYLYGFGNLEITTNLPKEWSCIGRVRGQLASANLLPSEQYGVGGYTTVRGYEERTLNGDEAFLASFEVRTPVMHIIRKKQDRLQFLGFIDYGLVHNHHRLEGEPYSFYIVGTGPGLRYTWAPYLSARLDLGIKLRTLSFEESRTFLHFGVLAAF